MTKIGHRAKFLTLILRFDKGLPLKTAFLWLALKNSLANTTSVNSLRDHYGARPIREEYFAPGGTNEPIIWPDWHPYDRMILCA